MAKKKVEAVEPLPVAPVEAPVAPVEVPKEVPLEHDPVSKVEMGPPVEAKKVSLGDTVSFPTKDFAKIFYALVAMPGIVSPFVGVSGRSRICKLLGAKSWKEEEEMWEEFKRISREP